MEHPEVGMAVLKLVADDLADDCRMEKIPSFQGRFLSMILTPPAGSPKPKAVKQEEIEVAQA